MDTRKPFLKSFTVKELMQFIDYYMEHREMLHVPGHPWEVCDLVARFLGFGYSRQWAEDETAVLVENYPLLGAAGTSELLPLRTAYDCKIKADRLGLRTNVRISGKSSCVLWTSHELRILSKYYPILGSRVMALLPGRTERACIGMAKKEGIGEQATVGWSERELEILKSKYPEMGNDISVFLPGRGENAIRTMAFKVGVLAPSKEWTPEEDEIIRNLYSQMGTSVAALFDGRRTASACQRRAHFLGVATSSKDINWSEHELEIFKKHYPSMRARVADLLPGRTETACRIMAAKLKIAAASRTHSANKKWTDEEIKILKESYPKVGAEGVHKLLPHRSAESCGDMAARYGVSACYTKWSDEEMEILKNNYREMGKDVAKLLPGRTVMTCQAKAASMGLTSKEFYWTAEEDSVLRTYYPREGKTVSRRFPNRSQSSCIARASKLGLCRIKSTDTAVPLAEEPPDGNQSSVKLSPDAEDSVEKQTLTENAGLSQIETPQSSDDIGAVQLGESSSMQFGSM